MRGSRQGGRIGVGLVVALLIAATAGEAWSRGRIGRARPQIERHGPASRGSFGREPSIDRRVDRPRDPGPDRRRFAGPGPDPGPEPIARPGGLDPADVREERRDEIDDRWDDVRRHRAWRLGTQLSDDEWIAYHCDEAELVEVDGDSLFECEGTWFVQTYYGGRVVYTVTDPPE